MLKVSAKRLLVLKHEFHSTRPDGARYCGHCRCHFAKAFAWLIRVSPFTRMRSQGRFLLAPQRKSVSILRSFMTTDKVSGT